MSDLRLEIAEDLIFAKIHIWEYNLKYITLFPHHYSTHTTQYRIRGDKSFSWIIQLTHL